MSVVTMPIDNSFPKRKELILAYFANRGAEILRELQEELGSNQYREVSQALQPKIKDSRDALARTVLQTAERDAWKPTQLFESILLIHHAANVTMLDLRNTVWPYEYMAFSRRVGELWESFCGLCFHYPLKHDLILEVPPVFAEVRNKLDTEILAYIGQLPIGKKQKKELANYYKKVWLLVDAGEIKLELDLHFRIGGQHYNIDFKSGFSSNEKGNTNRLLVVASIYTNIIDGSYKNLIMVRSPEEENNHYLRILKRSKLWEVFCGQQAYDQIALLSGFDLRSWIDANIRWESDLSSETLAHLKAAGLYGYLSW